MDNFDLKKYLNEGKLHKESLSKKEEKSKKDLISTAIDNLELTLNNLDEDKKLKGIDKEEERMLRLFKRLKDEGRTDELYAMAYTLRTKGVESLLQKKFVDYAYNNPEGLAKFGAKILKRDLKNGVIINNLDDDRVRFSSQKTNPSNTPKGSFVKAVFNFILKSNTDESSKFALIDLIRDPRNLIPGSTFEGENVKGNLLDTLPVKIRKNKAFKEVANNILRFKQGRAVGAGEGFLTVFGKDAQPSKTKNDLNIDGVEVEIKASPNGGMFSISDGSGDKGKGIDQLNKRFFPFLKKGSDFQINDPQFIEYIKEKGKPHLKNYFTQLYSTMDDSDVSKITDITWNNLGKNKKELSDLIKNIIFKYYKQSHGFDSFLVIDPITGDFTATSADKLPDNLVGVDWALTKGKDTQAVPDGFIRLSMK